MGFRAIFEPQEFTGGKEHEHQKGQHFQEILAYKKIGALAEKPRFGQYRRMGKIIHQQQGNPRRLG